MSEKGTSKYAQKVAEGKQRYGNGRIGCAHHRKTVEVDYTNAKVPYIKLPRFTEEATTR